MDWLAGRSLDAALQDAQARVKREPAAPKHRVFLFQLLAVLGQWDRALTQLNLAGEMDAAALPMVHTYRQALAAERLREAVFNGSRSPLVFGRPERWVALCIEALRLDAQGAHPQAKALRNEAFEQAPASPGRLEEPEGGNFAWIADADERLGPMTEAVIDGKYYWVPFMHVARIQIEPPADLRDLVWMPAYFRWTNGGESAALIPTRYPGSAQSADDRIRLAARTEWLEVGAGTFHGLGQRLITTDTGEYALMDLRRLSLDQPVADSEAEPSRPSD
ncbi:MAG: virulence protein SciE type [Chromatiaceae bacterium]|jgi:type VI secretion system protein ImpE|nr:virulence protein SciE type [Chromatiaceae bacterium]